MNYKQRQEKLMILREYTKELISLIEEKTELNFSPFSWTIQTSMSDIINLERFIHKNNLGDTNVIFKKYQKQINKLEKNGGR